MGSRRTVGRQLLLSLVTAGYLGVVAVLATQPLPAQGLAAVSGGALVLAGAASGVACLVRARSERDQSTRTAWRLIGVASLVWISGLTVAVLRQTATHRDVDAVTLADLGFLLAVPLWALALLQLAAPARALTTRLRTALDGVLICVSLVLISWVTVLGPVARASTDTLLGKIVLILYPAGDVVLVALAAYVVMRFRTAEVRPPVPLGLIVLAFFGFACGDSGYAYLSLIHRYVPGSLIDAARLGGFTILLIVALLPPRDRRGWSTPSHERPLGHLLPYAFVVVAALVSSMTHIGPNDHATRWLRTALIILVTLRQMVSLRENTILTRTLERRVQDRTADLVVSTGRFQALVEHSSDVVSLIRRSGEIFYQSEASQRVFGHPSTELVGRRFVELLDQPSRIRFNSAVAEAARGLRPGALELRLMHGDGAWRQVETTITNLLDDRAVGGLVLNTRDVSERRQLEDQLLHQAFHDSLTGLANRALFNDRVRHAMNRRAVNETIGVLFLDLDGFKQVNDSLGHAAGDALLIDVAARLQGCLRPGDTVARLGADEFAVLVEGARSSLEFTAVAERIRAALDSAVEMDGRTLHVRASIGLATAELGMNDAEQLVRNADLAMYRAKELRDGEFARYDPSMHTTLVERLALEAELRKAVAQELLHVHYQPTYTIDTGRLVGVEALIRWTHPERGRIFPDMFIPLAEQTGLIHDLGRFILREACLQGRHWLDVAPDQPLAIGVNLSGRQLQRAEFAQEVRDVLAETGLPPESLVLEMTESVLMDDTDTSLRALEALKSMGIRIAIDDFGTGYSSLSYLHRFPVDILKIDRSFVERLTGPDAEESLVQSIVQLAQTLNLETIAEGIEDHSQLLVLRRLGCQIAQGYHFGRPGPPDVIGALLLDPDHGRSKIEPPAESASGAEGAEVPRPRDGEDVVPSSVV